MTKKEFLDMCLDIAEKHNLPPTETIMYALLAYGSQINDEEGKNDINAEKQQYNSQDGGQRS